jgi:hypothetical protein
MTQHRNNAANNSDGQEKADTSRTTKSLYHT